MSIGSTTRGSAIENEIYNILDKEEYYASLNEYTPEAVYAVEEYLTQNVRHWSSIWTPFLDMSAYAVSFAWIENGEIQHIVIIAKEMTTYNNDGSVRK